MGNIPHALTEGAVMSSDHSHSSFMKQRQVASGKGDMGTVERWRHSGRTLELTEQAGIMAARAVDADVLDRLVLGGCIRPEHREAALRLRCDFLDAGMAAHLSGSYSPARNAFSFYGGWDERTEAEEKAYRRWRRAVESVGPAFRDPVISVVCYDEALASEKIALLTVGLVMLVKWYRSGDNPASYEKRPKISGD